MHMSSLYIWARPKGKQSLEANLLAVKRVLHLSLSLSFFFFDEWSFWLCMCLLFIFELGPRQAIPAVSFTSSKEGSTSVSISFFLLYRRMELLVMNANLYIWARPQGSNPGKLILLAVKRVLPQPCHFGKSLLYYNVEEPETLLFMYILTITVTKLHS